MDTSAFDVIQAQLHQWGLDDLAGAAQNLLQQGLGEDAILVQLQDTPQFKKRFAGNQARLQRGLAALSPAEYVATEQAYDQVLRQYGVDHVFSTRDNFAKWIGGDVSPTELNDRVSQASRIVTQTDPTQRALMQQWYGIGQNDLIAAFLDPDQALTELGKKEFATAVGAAMSRYGLGADQQTAENLFGLVGEDQAVQGLQQAGQDFTKTQTLAQRYGVSYSAQDAVRQYVLGEQEPADRQRRLSQLEEAQFARGSAFQSGGAGVSSGF